MDLDPRKLRYTAHNARVYGVAPLIQLVHGDARCLPLRQSRADLCFVAPPWGGVHYLSPAYTRVVEGGVEAAAFDVEADLPPALGGLQRIVDQGQRLARRVVAMVPRSVHPAKLHAAAPPGWGCTVHRYSLGGKAKLVTAAYAPEG